MEKISSSITQVQRVGILALALFGLVVGFRELPFPRSVVFAVAVLLFVVWWQVLRKLNQVWMDGKGLIVKCKTKDLPIPFQRIVSVRKVRFYRRPPVIVTYRDDRDALVELRFIPSMGKAGVFFTADNMVELLEHRADSARKASVT